MSIASNFPNLKPTLLLDFSNTEELDSRITFTRASTATYYGTETAKAEENLLLYSQDLTLTATWGNTNSTDAADVIASPDGTLTADSITDNATSGPHFVFQNITFAVDTTYTYSCFLKAGTSNFAVLNVTEAVSGNRYFMAEFDLSTGAVNRTQAGSSGTLTTQSITAVGSGWYRCVITGQTSVAATRVVVGVSDGTSAINNFGQVSYVGTGTDIYAWGAQLEQRSAVTAYTPTTTQAITNYIPVLETAASGVARFDHNPTTFESLGLEIEESRTNLVTYSEQFDDAAWSKNAASVTANTIVSPDGTVDGDKLIANTSNAAHHVAVSIAITSGVAYTLSFYAKAGEYGFTSVLFASAGFGTNSVDVFNLNNGTVSVNASGTAAITPVGNGWYRCSTTRTATATSGSTFQIRVNNAGTGADFAGNGYSGIYIWGAQLEAGAFATSYIPTVASQVTRAADVASMTGTNFSSWYNQAQGTMYAEGKVSGGSAATFLASVSDGTNSNRIVITTGSSNTVWNPFIITNGVSQGTFIGAGTPQNNSRLAIAFNTNDASAALNGLAYATDTSVTLPVVDRMFIGASPLGTPIFAYIKKLAYYPLRVTNAQLQALTS